MAAFTSVLQDERLLRVAGLLCAALLALAPFRPAEAQPAEGIPWRITVGGVGAEGAAGDKDISGAACAPDGRCLLVSDEKRRAWLFRHDTAAPGGPHLVVGAELELTPASGGNEADAEAAAFAGGWFYAVGSHGTGRNNQRFQASRFSAYRIDAEGRVEASGRLAELLAAVPEIAPHFCTAAKASAGTCQTLQAGGANIEGLAARDGSLLVGFRAPAPGGEAIVVRVATGAVFGPADPATTAFRLRLGQDAAGRDVGIRDLASVSDGVLVLAGPSLPEGDEAVGSGTVWHWSGGPDAPRRLIEVGRREAGVKPEVLLLLGEDAAQYRVLVMHDGVAGGAPLEYQIPR